MRHRSQAINTNCKEKDNHWVWASDSQTQWSTQRREERWSHWREPLSLKMPPNDQWLAFWCRPLQGSRVSRWSIADIRIGDVIARITQWYSQRIRTSEQTLSKDHSLGIVFSVLVLECYKQNHLFADKSHWMKKQFLITILDTKPTDSALDSRDHTICPFIPILFSGSALFGLIFSSLL